MRSLTSEDPEKVAIERDLITNMVLWAFSVRLRDERVDRAIELVVSAVPIQTVVPAFIADQGLRKLLGEVARRVRKILLLRPHQGHARLLRRHLTTSLF